MEQHTRRSYPISTEVNLNKYPPQDDIKLGNVFTIHFRSKNIGDQQYLTEEPDEVFRPQDDSDPFDPRDSQEFVDRYIMVDTFKLIRADRHGKAVLVSTDYRYILVTDTEYIRATKDNSKYCMISEQDYHQLGMYKVGFIKEEFYTDDMDGINLTYKKELMNIDNARQYHVISYDTSEPGFAVILEILDDSTYRVLLDDECYIHKKIEGNFPINPAESLEWNAIAYRKLLLEGREPYAGEEPEIPIPR